MHKGNGTHAQAVETETLSRISKRKLQAAREIAEADALLNKEFDAPPRVTTLEEPSKIEKIMTEIGGDGKFEVYKIIAGSDSKIGVYPISEWPDRMDVIARQHGGGDYKTKFKDKLGHYLGSDTQTFDPAAYGGIKEVAVANNGLDLRSMLEIMNARDQQRQTELEELRRQNSELLLKIVDSSSKSMFHNAEDIAIIANLFKSKEEPTSQLGFLREAMDFMRSLKEEDAIGESEPMTMITSRILSGLEAFLTAKIPQPTNLAPSDVRRAQQALSTPVAITTESTSTPEESASDWDAYREVLLNAINSSMTPESAVKVTAEQLKTKPENLPAIRTFLNDEREFTSWCYDDDELYAKREWLNEFRKKLIEALQ